VRLTLWMITISICLGVFFATPTGVQEPQRTWEVRDSKAYAKDKLHSWNVRQFKCLDELWTRESHWRPDAFNKKKVMGKHAGGIPQILGMSNKIPATIQIDRGIDYIMYRYGTPCKALAFHKKHWYY